MYIHMYFTRRLTNFFLKDIKSRGQQRRESDMMDIRH